MRRRCSVILNTSCDFLNDETQTDVMTSSDGSMKFMEDAAEARFSMKFMEDAAEARFKPYNRNNSKTFDMPPCSPPLGAARGRLNSDSGRCSEPRQSRRLSNGSGASRASRGVRRSSSGHSSSGRFRRLSSGGSTTGEFRRRSSFGSAGGAAVAPVSMNDSPESPTRYGPARRSSNYSDGNDDRDDGPYLFFPLSQDRQLMFSQWTPEDGITDCFNDNDQGQQQQQQEQEKPKYPLSFKRGLPTEQLGKEMAQVHAREGVMNLMFHKWRRLNMYRLGVGVEGGRKATTTKPPRRAKEITTTSPPSATTSPTSDDELDQEEQAQRRRSSLKKSPRNRRRASDGQLEKPKSYRKRTSLRNSATSLRNSAHSFRNGATSFRNSITGSRRASDSSVGRDRPTPPRTISSSFSRDRTTGLAAEFGPNLIGNLMKNMMNCYDCSFREARVDIRRSSFLTSNCWGGSSGQDIGMVFTFPIACAFSYAIRGCSPVVQEIGASIRSFWKAYTVETKKLMSRTHTKREIERVLTRAYREALGFCGWYLYITYYRMNSYTHVLPLHRVSMDDREIVLDAIGVIGLKLMRYGFEEEGMEKKTLNQFCHILDDILREEIDALLDVGFLNDTLNPFSNPLSMRQSLKSLVVNSTRTRDSFKIGPMQQEVEKLLGEDILTGRATRRRRLRRRSRPSHMRRSTGSSPKGRRKRNTQPKKSASDSNHLSGAVNWLKSMFSEKKEETRTSKKGLDLSSSSRTSKNRGQPQKTVDRRAPMQAFRQPGRRRIRRGVQRAF